MPTMQFALEPNQPKRLEISWQGAKYNDFTVKLDGVEAGKVNDQNALINGANFNLPDGSTLRAKLKKGLFSELELLRNGEPIPGSAADPNTRIRSAMGVFYFIGGFNILLGLLTVLFQIEFLQILGIGLFSIIFGAIYLLIGYFVSKHSMIALIIGMVLFIVDTVLGVILVVGANGSPAFGSLFARILFFFVMVQGFNAMREANRK